jgi:hypothetical protein
MAAGVNVRVVLDEKLDNEECKKITQQISKLPGVISAHFNEMARDLWVTHSGVEAVGSVEKKIKEIDGVKDIKPLYRL